ncbi:MAG: hypothetical protein ACRC7N_20085, partial [Clostridium sp.]
WMEIKRVAGGIVVEDGADDSLRIAEVFGKEIIFKESEIRVIDGHSVRSFDRGSISRDIRGFLRCLMK